MCDIYFVVEGYDIASYADGNTSNFGGEATENLVLNLEKISKNLFQWIYLNQMKGNLDKCYLLLSTSEKVTMNVQDLNIVNSKKGREE